MGNVFSSVDEIKRQENEFAEVKLRTLELELKKKEVELRALETKKEIEIRTLDAKKELELRMLDIEKELKLSSGGRFHHFNADVGYPSFSQSIKLSRWIQVGRSGYFIYSGICDVWIWNLGNHFNGKSRVYGLVYEGN